MNKIEKLTIKKVTVSDKNKDGQTLISKNNKPFFKVGIQVSQYGENWINGLVFGEKPTWKDGDEVELEVYDEEYNGRTSKKFNIPKKEDKMNVEILALRSEIQKIQGQLRSIIDHLSGRNRLDLTSAGTKVPDFSEVDDAGLDHINTDGF